MVELRIGEIEGAGMPRKEFLFVRNFGRRYVDDRLTGKRRYQELSLDQIETAQTTLRK